MKTKVKLLGTVLLSLFGYASASEQVVLPKSRGVGSVPIAPKLDDRESVRIQLSELKNNSFIVGRTSKVSESTPSLVDARGFAMQDRFLLAIQNSIKQHLLQAFPNFVNITLSEFTNELEEKGGILQDSIEEYIKFVLYKPDTFRYVVRDNRPIRESTAIYTYADAAVSGDDGIMNRVKRNVMDEMLMWLSVIMLDVPEELVNELEVLLDDVLGKLVDGITAATFQILAEEGFLSDDCCDCGCCGFGCSNKVSRETKRQIAEGLGGAIGSVCDRYLGQGFSKNAYKLTSGICAAIRESSSRH